MRRGVECGVGCGVEWIVGLSGRVDVLDVVGGLGLDNNAIGTVLWFSTCVTMFDVVLRNTAVCAIA